MKKLIQDLEKGNCGINLGIISKLHTNPKVGKLFTGKITVPEFLLSIDKGDPFELVEQYEGMLNVKPRKLDLPPAAYIPPDLLAKVENNLETIKAVFPELADEFGRIKNGCITCGAINLFTVLEEAQELKDFKERDFKKLLPIFGRIFVDKLKAGKLKTRSSSVRTSSKEKSRRLATCKRCKHFEENPRFCRKCNCSLRIKLATAAAECPIGKWKKEK